MNYQSLYSKFIADRLTNPPPPDTYTERHHIVPRCDGGSDDPSNLVRLTARDHIFAHLILAKWKGGKHWASVYMAVTGVHRSGRLPTAQEVRISAAAREEWGKVPRSSFYTPGVCAKIADASKTRWADPEQRTRMSEVIHEAIKGQGNPMFGRKHSNRTRTIMAKNTSAQRPETRARMSAAAKARWARHREAGQ